MILKFGISDSSRTQYIVFGPLDWPSFNGQLAFLGFSPRRPCSASAWLLIVCIWPCQPPSAACLFSPICQPSLCTLQPMIAPLVWLLFIFSDIHYIVLLYSFHCLLTFIVIYIGYDLLLFVTPFIISHYIWSFDVVHLTLCVTSHLFIICCYCVCWCICCPSLLTRRRRGGVVAAAERSDEVLSVQCLPASSMA